MEYIEKETVGDRLQLIARPLTLPGVCAVCGFAGTNAGDPTDVRLFVDFQLDIDYYGRVYLCSTCILQAGNSLSWVSVEQSEKQLTKLSEQENELIKLRGENEQLRSAVNVLSGSDSLSISILLGHIAHEQSGDESTKESIEVGSGENVSIDSTPSVERSDDLSNAGSDQLDLGEEFRL